MTQDFDWSGVRDRVSALCRARGGAEVFGASGKHGHGFAMADPLSEAEVAEVEAQFGVRLPAAYREFLLTVSAGGAGPYYGLALLSRGRGPGWDWHCDAADPALPERVGAPFGGEAGVAAAIAALDAHEAQEPSRNDFPDGGYEAARARWLEADNALFDQLVPLPGVVALAHHGCGYLDWLVVAGADRGTVWTDPDGTRLHLERLADAAGRPVTFFGWYMTWLEASEARRGVAGSQPAR